MVIFVKLSLIHKEHFNSSFLLGNLCNLQNSHSSSLEVKCATHSLRPRLGKEMVNKKATVICHLPKKKSAFCLNDYFTILFPRAKHTATDISTFSLML